MFVQDGFLYLIVAKHKLTVCIGARWQSPQPLSRNVAVLKVGCPWKIGGCETGREPCSQRPTYYTPTTAEKQAIAGMLATARIPASTGTPAISKGHQHGEGTTSTSKTPAIAGSVWKSYTSRRK